MSSAKKISERHRRPRAVVYVRQSSPGQLERNIDSIEEWSVCLRHRPDPAEDDKRAVSASPASSVVPGRGASAGDSKPPAEVKSAPGRRLMATRCPSRRSLRLATATSGSVDHWNVSLEVAPSSQRALSGPTVAGIIGYVSVTD